MNLTNESIKNTLGIQYPALNIFINYYKNIILSQSNISILEVANATACGVYRKAALREYANLTGTTTDDYIDLLVTTGPFIVVNKQLKVIGCFYNKLDRAYTVKCNNKSIKVSILDSLNDKIIESISYSKDDCWFIPAVSLLGATEAFLDICNNYNKRGVKVSINGRARVISQAKVASMRDMMCGHVTISEFGTGKCFELDILNIDRIARLK